MVRKIYQQSPTGLRRGAQQAKKRMTELFKKKSLQDLSEQCGVGQRRVDEQLAFALHLVAHMKQRHIRTVEELADVLYIGGDYLVALDWMRSPCGFTSTPTKKHYDEYLLALCDLGWDPSMKGYVHHKSAL